MLSDVISYVAQLRRKDTAHYYDKSRGEGPHRVENYVWGKGVCRGYLTHGDRRHTACTLLCPQANPLTPIPGPRARLGTAMAAEATTAVHGWPSDHAANLLGPRRMMHGGTRGYLRILSMPALWKG